MYVIDYDVCAAGITCPACGDYAECDNPNTVCAEHGHDFRGCACR